MKTRKKKIDWNRWHPIITDAIRAFEFDAALFVCRKCNIRHRSKVEEDDLEHEEVTADTLIHELFSVSEIMLKEHLSDGLQTPRCIDPDINIFRDEAGLITADIGLCQEGDGPIFNPCIEMKLYTEPGKEDLTINFQPAGQCY